MTLLGFWLHAVMTLYHNGEAANLLPRCFTGRSLSRQLRIFNPVDSKQKLTGEIMKHESRT